MTERKSALTCPECGNRAKG